MSDAPPRLVDVTDAPALRDALRAARAAAPDPEQIERMRRRLPRDPSPTGGGATRWRRALPALGERTASR